MVETPVDWMIADGTPIAQTASAREGDLGRSALKTGARKGRRALATTPTAKTDAMKGAPAGTPVVRRTISRKILYARYRPPKSSWGRLILGGCVVRILQWYSRLGSLASRGPASLEICALLAKPDRREVDIACRYVGFEIPNRFVVGYGLDADEHFRGLPYVATVDEARIAP